MRPYACLSFLVPLAVLAPHGSTAATISSFLVADQGRDEIILATDLNGDGDTNDAGEVATFFSGANASGLVAPTGNVFTMTQAASGDVYIGDGGTDSVYRLRDRNNDGTAQGVGEAQVWLSGSGNASGISLQTPNGIAEGPDGAIYVVEADTSGRPLGDWVYRTVDGNGDGDVNDAGEVTRWLDLKAVNPTASAFEIRFEGDTAYVIDSVGAAPNVIYSMNDSDGNGAIGSDEVQVFASADNAYGAVFDFAMDVGLGSVWTWQWLPEAGLSSVFRLTDLDGSGVIDAASEVVEVWSSALLELGYNAFAGFSLAVNDLTGEIIITSNDSDAGGDWVVRLFDLDGDGAFLGEGESSIVLSRLDQGISPDRPRSVAFYSAPVAPVPLPASLPLLMAGLAGLALLRRARRA